MITGPLMTVGSYKEENKHNKIKRHTYFCKYLLICDSEESAWCIKNAKSIIDRSSWKKLSSNGNVFIFGAGYCNVNDKRVVNECFEQHIEPAELKEIK